MEGPPPLRQNDPHLYRIERETGSIPREKSKATGILGTLAAFGVLIAKFFAPLAKLLPFLKSGGTMLVAIGGYAVFYGWRWAVGFVVLIFIHECGHMVAARQFGLQTGLPVFIPFLGAYVALKGAPRHAWIEAWVGIGGPILGSIGALLCHAAGEQMQSHLLIVLAQTGYMLNLLNLAPFLPLDGGRVIVAFGRPQWVAGLLALIGSSFVNPIVILLLAACGYCAWGAWRLGPNEEHREREITAGQRWAVWLAYFGLIALLAYGMKITGAQVGVDRSPMGF